VNPVPARPAWVDLSLILEITGTRLRTIIERICAKLGNNGVRESKLKAGIRVTIRLGMEVSRTLFSVPVAVIDIYSDRNDG